MISIYEVRRTILRANRRFRRLIDRRWALVTISGGEEIDIIATLDWKRILKRARCGGARDADFSKLDSLSPAEERETTLERPLVAHLRQYISLMNLFGSISAL